MSAMRFRPSFGFSAGVLHAASDSRMILLLLLLALPPAAGCAHTPRPPAVSGVAALDTFVWEVAQSLETHDWQFVLASADPEQYGTQVVELGMGEPQYVAELFGMHHVDNNIKRGDVVTWADLERIGTVTIYEVEQSGEAYRLHGDVQLSDGTSLRLQAGIQEQGGRYRLTGGVG